MSVARITTLNFKSKEGADQIEETYKANAPSEFPEAKQLLEVVENDYLVIDANGFLQNVIFSQGINYIAVGLPPTKEDK